MNPLRTYLKKIKNFRTWYLNLRKWIGFEKHLGMTTYSEQRHYYYYAKDHYKGQGQLVDLGSWLGSTALSLMKGLNENPRYQQSGNKLFCYDLFIWDNWMDSSVRGTNLEGKYSPGDSFLPEFEKRLSNYSSQIVVRAADLTKAKWTDGPIEYLLVDAMKSPELCNEIFKNFYPSLIPGTSQILHQDFCHFWTGWIHILQYRLRYYFEYLSDVPNSGSTAFKYIKSIPKELFSSSIELNQLTDNEINEAFNYALNFISKINSASIWAAKIMLYVHMGKKQKAQEVIQKTIELGITINEDLEKSRAQLLLLN